MWTVSFLFWLAIDGAVFYKLDNKHSSLDPVNIFPFNEKLKQHENNQRFKGK